MAAEVANEMVRRGHCVSVYMDAERDESPSYDLHDSIEQIKIPMRQGANDRRIRDAIMGQDPDVFFIFFFNFMLVRQYGWVADSSIPVGAQECTNPQRAVANILKAEEVPDVPTAYNLRKALLSGMHGIRFTMSSYRESLPDIAKPYGRAFKNAFAPADSLERRNDPARRKSIINVGGLKSRNKNGVVLAEAFALVADAFPDWDLNYVGGAGLQSIHEVIRSAGLEDRIHLGGVTNDISTAYADADIHAICSFQEGCPNVVCEAMLHGLPSIGFADCSGTNELIQHDVNGVLVDRRQEVENLAEALRKLMSDEGQRARLGEAALAQATRMFDRTTIYDHWEALFAQIASYKDNPDRLFEEQASASLEAATRMRHLRSKYLLRFRGDHLRAAGALNNEKISISGAGAATDLPLVSFIIPVFNKGAFIEETIESVLSDSYPAKEIIAVDDCSTDGSTEKLASYQNRHENFHLVRRKSNGGLSRARNTGIDHAKGIYIQFWDADDVYGADSLEKVVGIMEEDESDIATAPASRDGRIIDRFQAANHLHRRAIFALSPEAYSTSTTCFKIYRASFLKANNLRFVDGLFLQDQEFNFRAFCLSSSVSMTPYVLGEYRLVANSGATVVSHERMDSSLEIDRLTRDFIAERGLHSFERFRQCLVLKRSFLFFITALMAGKGGSAAGANDREAADYLERYRVAVGKLGLGISDLYASDPNSAVGLLAFGVGRDELAATIFGKKPCPKGFESQLIDNPFGFPDHLIHAMCARLNRGRWFGF